MRAEDGGAAREVGTHSADGRALIHAESRAQWRSWLERHHEHSSGAWLVTWKKASGRPYLPYPEAVDEALCFGWVDSRPNRLDDLRAMRLFTPRRPRSPWSAINKGKVARLTEQRLMAPAGIRVVEAAKASGSWSAYDEVERLVIPPDLARALAVEEGASALFGAFPDSSKKNILWWIRSARRPETRAARVKRAAELAARNRMANHPAGRDRGPDPRRG